MGEAHLERGGALESERKVIVKRALDAFIRVKMRRAVNAVRRRAATGTSYCWWTLWTECECPPVRAQQSKCTVLQSSHNIAT
jgi:hypothetical protein